MVDEKKTHKLPSVTVDTDFNRGSPRYIFKWKGFNRELFSSLKMAGAQAEKMNDEWTIWATPEKFPPCFQKLSSLEVNLVSTLNLQAEFEKNLEVVLEPYTVINIGTVYVTVHFDFNRPMIDALKTFVPADGRVYDEYTHDWKIRHEYISLLISAWRTLGIPVRRLEDIRKIVS